jgi:hypothetical protein
MWSPRAEQVVANLLAALPANLDAATLANALRLSALPIGGSLWSECYLRPSGEVVFVGEDLDHPDVDTVYSDPIRVLMVLVWGSERYPELKELIPSREAGATNCVCIEHPEIFGRGKLICSVCGGVGWLPANEPPQKT